MELVYLPNRKPSAFILKTITFGIHPNVKVSRAGLLSNVPCICWYIYFWNLQFLNNVIINKIKKIYEINWRKFQGNTWRLPNNKKRMNLYSFHGNVMTKSVVTRMSFRLDKDVETYLLKSRSDDNEKMSFNRQFIRGLTFIKKIIYTTLPFLKLL